MKDKPWFTDSKHLKPYVLKPTPIPDGFVLLQDTRECRPLFTRIPKGLTVMSKTLSHGDYSILGFESKFCVERKAGDLYPYCSTERDKTLKKMKAFKQMEFVGLIIEGRESEIYQFQQHTKIHPEVIRGALTSFAIRYKVHIYIGNRENCTRQLLDWATKYYTVAHEV